MSTFATGAAAHPASVPEIVAATDDYDSCGESGSVCTRKINDYTAEVKGNAAHGDQDGAIGSVDQALEHLRGSALGFRNFIEPFSSSGTSRWRERVRLAATKAVRRRWACQRARTRSL